MSIAVYFSKQMASLTNLSFMKNFNLNLQEELNHCSFGFPGVTGARSQDWCTAPPKTCRPVGKPVQSAFDVSRSGLLGVGCTATPQTRH